MARLFGSPRIPREVGERLRIAAASATEKVMDEHVARALEVVREGGERAPVERLLSAYARLHYLDVAHEGRLRERVLAALGREPGSPWTQRELAAPRSLFRRIQRRLRGRVNVELREWIDHHTARVHLELVDLHVREAMEFVRILDGHATTREAIDSYADMLHLRPAIAEFVRLKTMLAVQKPGPGARVEPLRPRASDLPLRIADSGS